jgi:ADP-ribose pyrophosphatase YjhB (NUDIX family)
LIDACARESLEEINLSNVDPDKLYCAFMMRVFPPEQREHFCHIFLYQTKGDEDFRFNDGEVEELKWISLGKLRELVKKSDDLHARIDTNGIPAHGEKIAPRGRVYFAQLFQHLARVSTLEAQNG